MPAAVTLQRFKERNVGCFFLLHTHIAESLADISLSAFFSKLVLVVCVCFLVLLLEGNKELLGKGFNSEEIKKEKEKKKGGKATIYD